MPLRRPLPNRRRGESFTIKWLNRHHTVTLGYFEKSDDPAELFISLSKPGTELDGVARDGAVLVSLCLQYGVPFQTIAHAITRDQQGNPMTIVGAAIDIILKEQGK